MIQLFEPVQSVLDRLVHKCTVDAVIRFRQRAFIAAHLIGGVLGMLIVPLYFAIYGAPTGTDIFAFAWLSVPMLLTVGLAYTGWLRVLEFLSIVSFSSLVVMAVWTCGGLSSNMLGWFIPVLLYAASTGRRDALMGAAFGVVFGVFCLGLAEVTITPPAVKVLTPLWMSALSTAAIIGTVYTLTIATGLDAAKLEAARLRQEDEARYRLLADNATDLITRHTRSGNVLFASPAARDLVGVDAPDLINDGLFSLVHVADRPAYLSVFPQAAESGEAATVEFRIRKSLAGEAAPVWRWVEMRCRRFSGGAGDRVIELVAVTRDIESHRRQEEALLRANAEAERASHAKTRFLANISHELRTPLNAIIGFSEMLTLDMPMKASAERVAEYAKLINESGRHLLDVVNGILDMSKLEAGSFTITPEPFDVAVLVKSTVAIMAPLAEKVSVELVCTMAQPTREVIADSRACKQILLNLLSNAIKFTEPGGKVSVSTAFDERNVFLTVSDTGIGIDEKDLPTLATPFVQAHSSYDRRYEGTGLGLSVVKGLIELHGGELSIRSKLGVGTTVTVSLPLDSERAGADVRQLPARQKSAEETSQRRRSVA